MVSFQGNGGNLPLSFHLVNDKGNHGEIKPSGRRVEMKSQFNLILEFNMKLELVEVDCDGANSGISRHFLTASNSLKENEILTRTGNNQKNVTVYTVTYNIRC